MDVDAAPTATSTRAAVDTRFDSCVSPPTTGMITPIFSGYAAVMGIGAGVAGGRSHLPAGQRAIVTLSMCCPLASVTHWPGQGPKFPSSGSEM